MKYVACVLCLLQGSLCLVVAEVYAQVTVAPSDLVANCVLNDAAPVARQLKGLAGHQFLLPQGCMLDYGQSPFCLLGLLWRISAVLLLCLQHEQSK